MPLLRRDDQARNHRPDCVTGFHEDRRPAPPRLTGARNGLPAPRPYTYQGSEPGGSIPRLPTAGLSTMPAPQAPVWRLSSQALLDVCEAIDGPSWFDWREWRDEDGAA